MPIPADSAVTLALSMAILSRPAIQAIDGDGLDALCEAIAEVITATIKDGTVTVNPLGLVAPPGAGGGPVTGSATGSIS